MLNPASPKEKYVTLTVAAGDFAIWGDEAICLNGNSVGYVTSGGFGAASECHIALGFVDIDACVRGGQFSVEILGELRDAELHENPIYDAAGTRMRPDAGREICR